MMNNLHIALQSGFRNDSVCIKVNRKKIYDKSGITTNLVISLADTINVPVEGQTARIDIEVSTQKIKGGLDIRLDEASNVAVSLTHDCKLEMIPSKQPFLYF
jgi:hypothetical protein